MHSHLPEEKTVFFLTVPYRFLWKWVTAEYSILVTIGCNAVLHVGDVHCIIMVMEVQGEEKKEYGQWEEDAVQT